MIADARVGFVAFTGSVAGGHAVQRRPARRFIGTGLELGGKDPAYVRADAPLEHDVENLVDGAFFNAGQSCCGVERIYVHRDVYRRVRRRLRRADAGGTCSATRSIRPRRSGRWCARARRPSRARPDRRGASRAGRASADRPGDFPADPQGTPYLAPQVLVDVDHSMRVMTEETFGPVVGIMAVTGDDEAVALMNDSRYGLTASVWTADADAAVRIGDRVETGTWFLNRCDYLDPALAWTGVKTRGAGARCRSSATTRSPGRSRFTCASRCDICPDNRCLHGPRTIRSGLAGDAMNDRSGRIRDWIPERGAEDIIPR